MIKKIFTNSFGILFSRILGFVRDLLMASVLGASIYSDIFFVAFKLPNLFRRIFGEGAFVQSFLPSFARAKKKFAFASSVFVHFMLILLLLSLCVTFFAPSFTKLIAYGFDDDLIEIAAPYVAINFYYLDLIFTVTFLAALLQYKEHFATTAFSTALLNLSLILALLLFWHEKKEDVVLALSIAVLVGGIAQLVVHLWMAKRMKLLEYLLAGLKRKPYRNDLLRFYSNFFPAILGNSTAQISAFLDTWLASFLATGSISYLYYANRVFQLPLALFAIATATALFPSISKAINKNNEKEAFLYIKRSFWFLLTLLALSTTGGIFLAQEIVQILFERGSFTHKDTIETALVLQMYLVGLIFYGVAKLFSLWLYARHEQKKAAKIASYSLVLNIVLSLLLLFPLKAAGLALASSLAGAMQLLLLIKAFGFKRFLSLLKDRFAIYLPFILGIEMILLIFFKRLIDAYL